MKNPDATEQPTAPTPVACSDLLACPFCGQAPKMHEQFMMRLMADTAQVQCVCGCYSPLHNTPAEAAKWWNTRQANGEVQR
jgi:Lar family restriction alleviation protein